MTDDPASSPKQKVTTMSKAQAMLGDSEAGSLRKMEHVKSSQKALLRYR